MIILRPPLLARANSGLTFRPDANTVLWLPGQDDAYSTTIRDRSGKGNDGTILGASWNRNSQGLWYLDCDGTDDYVTIADHASLKITGDMTIKIWINPDAGAGIRSLVSKSDQADTTAGGYASYVQTGTRLIFSGSDGVAFSQVEWLGALTVSIWQPAVLVYDESEDEVSAYVNGALISAKNLTNKITANAYDLLIGADDAGGTINKDLDARLALPGLLNVAWTAVQVADNRNQERHLFGV